MTSPAIARYSRFRHARARLKRRSMAGAQSGRVGDRNVSERSAQERLLASGWPR